jgi:hypothetical protein
MKSVSLKIDNRIFCETEDVLSKMKISRNRYINEAIDHYNRVNHRRLLKGLLIKESNIVRDDSMEVLRDFEDIDDED